MSTRVRSCLLAALLGGFLSAAPGFAQLQRPVSDDTTSWLHRALLDRCDLIVVARFQEELALPDHIALHAFKVEQTIRGKALDRVLIGNADPRAIGFRDLSKVLFLKEMTSGRVCQVVDVVDLTKVDETDVPATIRRYLEIEATALPADRDRLLKTLSLENLDSRSVFVARTAALELSRIARARPWLFDQPERTRLTELSGQVIPEARADLLAIAGALTTRTNANLDRLHEGFPAGPVRDEVEGALKRLLSSDNPDHRIRILEGLAGSGGPTTVPICEALLDDPHGPVRACAAKWLGTFCLERSHGPLAKGLPQAEGDELQARIDALGRIGHPDAIMVLRPYLEQDATLDGALLAMARIGGLEAEILLDRIRQALIGRPGEEERVARIRYYRSEEFQQAEAERRRSSRQ